MKKMLYPLIATALITITPFLSTFEKGQDVVHGLFDYSVLFLLLMFIYAKERYSAKTRIMLLIVIALLLLVVAFLDEENILTYKGWSSCWWYAIPIVTCSVALLMLKPVRAMSLSGVSGFLFILLMFHFYLGYVFPEQPLLEFPVSKWMARQAPNDWARNNLSDDFRIRYNATDSVLITKYYVDSARSNVIVLVESWGIPMDSAKFNEELSVFEGVLKHLGVHFRWYSRTRTAEREDLLDSAWRDSTRRRDSLFMPKHFAELGYNTTFLFGGDSAIQWRYKYIRNIGFQNAIWRDSATVDAAMATKIDSLLSQSDSVMQFIAWTTRDTRFPISDDPVETEKLYYERLFGTLRIIADLAKKHPEVRFVVQGDHEPILSPHEFQAKFYRRWVPYVVLN